MLVSGVEDVISNELSPFGPACVTVETLEPPAIVGMAAASATYLYVIPS
jgi:hypothetical protein